MQNANIRSIPVQTGSLVLPDDQGSQLTSKPTPPSMQKACQKPIADLLDGKPNTPVVTIACYLHSQDIRYGC